MEGMTPFEKAEQVCEQDPRGNTFYRDLLEHFQRGIVYSTPTAFIMGRAVVLAEPENIFDLSYEFLPGEVDCWFVWLAAGNLGEFFSACPFPLPHISYQTGRKFKTWDFHRLRNLVATKDHGQQRRQQRTISARYSQA